MKKLLLNPRLIGTLVIFTSYGLTAKWMTTIEAPAFIVSIIVTLGILFIILFWTID
jgi:hypothetical protein